MADLRKRPFIYVTWLKGYLIGDDLCRWSIWHRVFHYYEKAQSDFNAVKYSMKHTALMDEVRKRYIAEGYMVYPEMDVYISGGVAELKGRVDLVAIREDKNLIIEVKTGKPKGADKIQLLLYIWALPRTYTRFRGAHFEGLLVYENYEIEVTSLELDELFLKNFQQFTKDILSGEPDRKHPSPRECKWCTIANCDERDHSDGKEDFSDYSPDFF